MKSKNQKPLKEEQMMFLKDYADFHQKWSTPNIAKLFGRTRQSVHYYKSVRKGK